MAHAQHHPQKTGIPHTRHVARILEAQEMLFEFWCVLYLVLPTFLLEG